MKPFITAVLILLLVFAVSVAAFSMLQWISDETLLDRIALIQPGMKLESIKSQLGKDAGVITDPDYMIHLGAVKDRGFCEGKKLHRFAVNMTGGEVSVYTDQNDVVVYVSWLQE